MRMATWVALLLWVGCAAAHAGPEVLWRIGAPDNDYREFAIAGRHGEYLSRFPGDVTFRVGSSDPARDWPFIQPATTDAWAGGRQHPFRIEFELSAAPQGVCRLTLDLVNTHYAAPPLVEVNINERVRYRFQAPAGGTDASLTDPAAGKEYVLPVAFPARHLQAGRNVITVTGVAGSWLLYDAVWLEAGVPMPEAPEVNALQAASTLLFRKVDGELKQAIRVMLNNTGIEGEVEVRLTGARLGSQRQVLAPGSNLFFVLVKPFERPEKLQLSVRAGNKETSVEFEGRPERRWMVFFAPSTHTDIGYTDWQERTFQRHVENTQAALKACDENPTFAWNLEVAHQAPLLRQHDPEGFEALVRRARQGRIGVQGLYLNMLTGICSGEELVLATTRAQKLARQFGYQVTAAGLTDVPTAVGTLPMLLRGSGIRYFVDAVNEYRAPVFGFADPRIRHAPFWWEGLDGSRVLAVFCGGYAQGSGLGMVQSVDQMARQLPDWLRGFDREDYPADAVLVYGAFSDNQAIDTRYGDVVNAWNAQWDYPKVRMARLDEFFRYVEERYGKRLPVLRGDMGVYWEDGAASSAHETALTRWARARLEGARRWLALGAALGAGAFPSEAMDQAWEEVLFYDEHTWGAWCSISDPDSEQTRHQWDFKARYATRAAERAAKLHQAACGIARFLVGQRGQAAQGATGHQDSARTVVVLNEHSWPRDVVVAAPAGMRVRPVGGRAVLVQPSEGKGVFLAQQVPPFGYRAYVLEPGETGRARPLLREGADGWSWEGAGYRIRVDARTGAIASLEDRRQGREWVESAKGYGLNQFLYVTGGEGSRLIQPGAAEAKPVVHTHTQARVQVVENGPVRAVLQIERRGDDAPLVETTLILYRNRRLDLVNVVRKEATTKKEAGYFVFPFRLRRPEAASVFIELPYGVVRAEAEQMAGGCREWYTTPSFAAVSDGAVTATLATPHAPLLTLSDIFRGLWRAKLTQMDGTLCSYAFNNYWDTNYKAAQGGEMVFAYSLRLRAGRFDPADATRFGWECASDMADPRAGGRAWTGAIEAVECDQPVAASGSLLQVKPSAVVVGGVTWEAGRLHVRLYNPGARAVRASLEMPGCEVQGAWSADLAGQPVRELPVERGAVSAVVPARGVVTVALAL